MQFWGFLGKRPGTAWQPQRSSWWIRAKTFNWTIIRQFAHRVPYMTPWFLIPSRRRRGRGARMTRPKGPSLLLFSWLLLRVLNEWTYHRLQLLFDALNILMETTLGAFSTQTGWVVLIILTRIHRLLWLVLGQRFICKIAHFYCKNMDFLSIHGSNMGKKQCYGVDILPNYIHLACQMW